MGKLRRTIFAAVAAFGVVANAAEDFRLYNIVPMNIGREAELAARCVDMCERTGEDLALYSLTLHPEGRPATEKVNRYIESFRAFQKALEGTKVHAGVLVQSIIGHWPRTDKDIEPWARSIDIDGKAVRFCPADPGFGAYVDYVFTELAKARPAFILTDDDVRAFSHRAECFCDAHVRLFNERRGTVYTGEQLREAVRKSKPGDPNHDVFLVLQREMMESFVGRIRKAVDAVDPSLPMGFCVAGEEHYYCVPLARRIAGRGQRPILRASTGLYGEEMGAGRFPSAFMRICAFAEFCRGEGVDILDEADTCPHNLWSKSARSFHTHMAAAAFEGYAGAKTWYVNGLKAGILVAPEYTNVMEEKRGRLGAIARAVRGTRSVGLAAPCFQTPYGLCGWSLTSPGSFLADSAICSKATTRFGVPVTASREFGDKSVVFALSTAWELGRMTDEELKRLLSGRVIVFRDAAVALTQRGFSSLTGVKAVEKPMLFNSEQDNRSGARLAFTPANDGSVEFTVEEGAERLCDFVFRPYAGAKEFDVVAPSTVFWRNSLGGEVITASYHHKMFLLDECSEARKAWFIACVDRLCGGGRLSVCGNAQDVLMAERVADDGTRYVFAVNMNSEPIRGFRLRTPEGGRVKALSANGEWRELSSSRDGDYEVLDLPLAFYEDAVLKIAMPRPDEN